MLTGLTPPGLTSMSYPFVWKNNLYFFTYDGLISNLVRWDGTTAEILAPLWPLQILRPPFTCAAVQLRGARLEALLRGRDDGFERRAVVDRRHAGGHSRGRGHQPVPCAGQLSCNLRAMNNRLYFSADDGMGGMGYEFWSSDGTASGTSRVIDLTPGAGSSTLGGATVFNNALYFSALGANGTQTWKSDGTAAGTRPLVTGSTLAAGPVGVLERQAGTPSAARIRALAGAANSAPL